MEHEQDAGYILFATEALLKRLQALTQEMDGVRQAQDIEYIHRMRVASRRLRSAITLFEECLPRKKLPDWQKQVRRITRALGAARDTDVQIDLLDQVLRHLQEPSADEVDEDVRRYPPGIERLRLRLRQRREKLQTDVSGALDAWEASQVTEELGQTLRQQLVQARLSQVEAPSPRVYQQAYLITSLRLEEMLAYEASVYHPEQVEELHAMRIAAKRLRYTLEVFAPLYDDGLKQPLQTVRQVQDVLGDIHDCDVWVLVLPQFMEERTCPHTQILWAHPVIWSAQGGPDVLAARTPAASRRTLSRVCRVLAADAESRRVGRLASNVTLAAGRGGQPAAGSAAGRRD